MSKPSKLEVGVPIFALAVVVLLWWLWGTMWAPMMRASIATRHEGIAAQQVAAPRAAASAPDSVSSPVAATPDGGLTTSDYFQQLGQTGDLFGGVNALFASIAVVGVFWAGFLQRRTLIESRRAIAEQQFETAFFELLKLTREVAERIEVRVLNRQRGDSTEAPRLVRTGAAALNALAKRNFDSAGSVPPGTPPEGAQEALLRGLVKRYKAQVYSRHPSALGPYFRLLYQTFSLVHDSQLSDDRKIRYANIARGQISEGAVLLLALNGLTWRGRKFVQEIERFGLLEHMHPTYLREYGRLLRIAYRENAFRGSSARAAHPHERHPGPGPNAFDREPHEMDFVMSVPPEDWVNEQE